MDEMIERVAAALIAAWSKAVAELNGGTFDLSAELSGEELKNVRRQARAAIEAMREPTEAMTEAADDIIVGFVPGDCWGDVTMSDYPERDAARTTWRAMIDAALSDQPPSGAE